VAGTLCRNSTGPCDEPAYCDGRSEACPVNPLASPTTVSQVQQCILCCSSIAKFANYAIAWFAKL